MTKTAKIFYFTLQDEQRKEEKLEWLKTTPFKEIPFERLTPDKNHNWINLAEENDWESLLPIYDKDGTNHVFELCFNGIQSNRDEWVYDLSRESLAEKVRYFIERYNQSVDNMEKDFSIKWTYSLEDFFQRKAKIIFENAFIHKEFYRPFFKSYHYCQKQLNHRLTKNHYEVWGTSLDKPNICLNFSGISSKEFACLVLNDLVNVQFYFNSVNVSLYRYDKAGNRVENITDWGLEQFRSHYSNLTDFENLSGLGKLEIFHYVYAVLHNPAYRQKYELNLKREFPRLPFYPDFWQWVKWGKTLMELHVNYETVTPFKLKQVNRDLKDTLKLKVKLKADKLAGTIEIDEQTTLHGIPEAAWEYKLGNRSALEWILDQYKEKKPSDPTIAEKFNTYRFADYKEQVIELLQRVCTVSVRTVEIIKQMEKP
jgi:predicted helicase